MYCVYSIEGEGSQGTVCTIGCPDLSNIQLCMLLFGIVMYGYHMDQNPKDGIYS